MRRTTGAIANEINCKLVHCTRNFWSFTRNKECRSTTAAQVGLMLVTWARASFDADLSAAQVAKGSDTLGKLDGAVQQKHI